MSDKLFTNKKNIENYAKSRVRTISVINFLFMPIIITFILFYKLFTYGEQFYSKPDLLASREFTKKILWKQRNYTELPHEFEKRNLLIKKLTKKYLNLFRYKFLEGIINFTIFVLSSIFITLLFLTILNDDILINLYIFKGKTVLWFLGISGSVIAILKNFTKKDNTESPEVVLRELSNYMIVDDYMIANAGLSIIKNKFTKIFNYKIYNIFTDILFTCIMPFELWKLSYNIPTITDSIKQFTKYHSNLGYICSISDYENISYLRLEKDNEESLFENLLDFSKKKIEFSYANFTKKYPNTIHDIEQSIKVNII